MENKKMGSNKEISDLIERLGDSDRHERLKARHQLMSMGKNALPAITDALFKADENIRWQAAKILSELQEPETAPALVKVLADDDHFGVRWLAAEGLIGMKLKGIETILQALIHRPDSVWLRQGVHHVLHSLHDSKLTGDSLDDVLTALEGWVPSVEIPVAAKKALEDLRSHGSVSK